MVSLHHLFDSFSILGMVVGTFLIPMAIIGGLFLIIKAVVGLP
jgi:hypothetical protein